MSKTRWEMALMLMVVLANVLSSTGTAAVRNVPVDYPTIQGAILASTNGDLVLVSPGVYNENINFSAKAITLSSTNADDINVVRETVIHGVSRRSVVTFNRGETTNSVLRGFTITGGYGNINALFDNTTFWGAGIYCYTSSPTIVANIIVSNTAPDGSSNAIGYGSGVACIQSSAVIARNWISGNSGFGAGGVITYAGQPRIANNVVRGNYAKDVAGGVLVLNGGQLINNVIVGNSSALAGNVYANSSANAQSLVSGNIICNATNGGGLYLEAGDTYTQVTYNDIWNNTNGDYPGGDSLTGHEGNISLDPQFVSADNNDFHLRDVSPCINAGDPAFLPMANEADFYGDARVYAGQVDIGASEYSDNFRPVADAGPDQVVGVTNLPFVMRLAGTNSFDPQDAALSFHWRQLGGPAGILLKPDQPEPEFTASALGTYIFELVVSNGTYGSFPDPVQVTIKNDPPVADPGNDQLYSDAEPIGSITLNGSRSYDPQQGALTYRWKQLSGWKVELSDPSAPQPSFPHPWPGTYEFELVVNNGFHDSQPAVVAIVIGPLQPPIADAGSSRYVGRGPISLDGTRSHGASGHGALTFHWQQVSGPNVSISGTNTPTPLLSGFVPTGAIQKCVFELVVNDGHLSSLPARVTVTIVRNFGADALNLVNPPFDPAKPTILAFGGGNCSTGGALTFGGIWERAANWITVDSYGAPYTKYGDMLIAYLSNVAPDYDQPIQTTGWSTGNLPAMDTAWYMNPTYGDVRFSVQRVSLLDAVCSDLSAKAGQFSTNRVNGKRCWVDNYISNASGFSIAATIRAALNVTCNPGRDHYYPVARYISSPLGYTNGGMTAFGYLSVIGDGKNYELNARTNKYYFRIDSTESMVHLSGAYSGKVMAPVQLTGPDDGAALGAGGASLGCQPVENAVRYQLLLGTAPTNVAGYTVLSETTNPPLYTLSSLPQSSAWWTVKAYDQFDSSIYADVRLITQPANRAPVANAGLDQVLVVGPDGTATATLSAANSTDPEGNALSYVWAWLSEGKATITNGASLTVRLPIGTHPVQLVANDGQINSEPVLVKISVTTRVELTTGLDASGQLRLKLTCSPGQRYAFESSTNLTDWIEVSAATAGADGVGQLTIVPDASAASRFYRARIEP